MSVLLYDERRGQWWLFHNDENGELHSFRSGPDLAAKQWEIATPTEDVFAHFLRQTSGTSFFGRYS